jgi:hypothetical protein
MLQTIFSTLACAASVAFFSSFFSPPHEIIATDVSATTANTINFFIIVKFLRFNKKCYSKYSDIFYKAQFSALEIAINS